MEFAYRVANQTLSGAILETIRPTFILTQGKSQGMAFRVHRSVGARFVTNLVG